MKAILLCLVAGCAYGSYNVNNDAGIVDAAIANNGGLCCKIINNETDSSLYINNVYECSIDSGPNYSNIPWICITGQGVVACSDTDCIVGTQCQGENGNGVVIDCNGD